jgi:hypothetical protein
MHPLHFSRVYVGPSIVENWTALFNAIALFGNVAAPLPLELSDFIVSDQAQVC